MGVCRAGSGNRINLIRGSLQVNRNEIMKYVDHTLLLQTATWDDIKRICDDALKYETASVCIPPSYVKQAAEYLGGRMAVCTVIGFPNGYNTTAVKCAETADAIANGADEIDMVINIGDVKSGRYDRVLEEIKSIKAVCGEKILKVIVETCLLTDDEKVRMCRIVTDADVDFIKTSTGFSTAGATPEDIKLFADNVGPDVKIKAAGGIRSFEDAERFISLGATRLGTSRLVTLLKNEEGKGSY